MSVYKDFDKLIIGDEVECIQVHIQSLNSLTKGKKYRVLNIVECHSGKIQFYIRADNGKIKYYKTTNSQFKALDAKNSLHSEIIILLDNECNDKKITVVLPIVPRKGDWIRIDDNEEFTDGENFVTVKHVILNSSTNVITVVVNYEG